MGRRLGFFDHVLREMDRADKRRASEAARAERHVQSMQRRAYERELIRQERSEDRARIQRERDKLKRQQEASKEAQLAAWKAEVEEHQERDQDLLTLCNDAPEIEERERLFQELLERNEFLPQPYVPPPIVQPDRSRWEQNRVQLVAKMETELESLSPKARGYSIAVLAGVGGILVGGAIATLQPFPEVGAGIAGLGCVVTLAARSLGQVAQSRQLSALRLERLQVIEAQLDQEWSAMVQAAKEESAHQESDAKAAYEQATDSAKAQFAIDESERIAKVQRLLAGNQEQMEQMLADLLPLDLPVACNAIPRINGPEQVMLELEIPDPSIIPAQEAKLLQSGKVSYKDKSPKRLREEYSKMVAGLALRYVSEIMLHLPTVRVVQVEGWRVVTDSATGHQVEQVFLELTCDFASLAKLKMDGIEPLAALKNFPHHLGEGRVRGAAG